MTHPYYKLKDGTMISKSKVDDAYELINSLRDGFDIIYITDHELFTSEAGNTVEATRRFLKKYDCTLRDALEAIKFLRGVEDD